VPTGIPAVTPSSPRREQPHFSVSRRRDRQLHHLLHERLPYDPKELVPLAPAIDNFLGVSASATLKVNTLAELIAAAKAQPAANYAQRPASGLCAARAAAYAAHVVFSGDIRDRPISDLDRPTHVAHIDIRCVPTLQRRQAQRPKAGVAA